MAGDIRKTGMKELSQELLQELMHLERELKNINCWAQQVPPPEALMSTMPFCVDTLEFPQWVQFIFIVRMRAIINENLALPHECNIAPMAEEYFKAQKNIGDDSCEIIVQSFKNIDKLLKT